MAWVELGKTEVVTYQSSEVMGRSKLITKTGRARGAPELLSPKPGSLATKLPVGLKHPELLAFE